MEKLPFFCHEVHAIDVASTAAAGDDNGDDDDADYDDDVSL